MKIVLPVYNYELKKEKIIDGGSVLFNNIKRALIEAGHEAEMVDIYKGHNADVMIIQSEWVETESYKTFKGRKIVLLGHFIGGVYPNPKEIKAELFTAWKGDLLEGFNTTFFPHAFIGNEREKINRGDVVWCGNTYSLRNEGWLAGVKLERIKDVTPEELTGIYKGAVCPNIHGDFQLGVVSNDTSRIADKAGYMINERFWHAIGAGGVLIQQYNPQILEFFDEDEILMTDDKDKFQWMIEYYRNHIDEGVKFYERARKKVLESHTYKERIKLLNL